MDIRVHKVYKINEVIRIAFKKVIYEEKSFFNLNRSTGQNLAGDVKSNELTKPAVS